MTRTIAPDLLRLYRMVLNGAPLVDTWKVLAAFDHSVGTLKNAKRGYPMCAALLAELWKSVIANEL